MGNRALENRVKKIKAIEQQIRELESPAFERKSSKSRIIPFSRKKEI